MQNRGSLTLAELRDQLDRDEQWRQLAAHSNRWWWLELVIGALLVALLYFGGLL